MGSALVQTHHYKRAINYYVETIKSTGNPDLKLQLAELYLKLKEHDKAQSLLKTEIDSEKQKGIDDVVSLQFRTQLHMLLSQVHENSGNFSLALSTLKDARDNQNRLRKLHSLEQTGLFSDSNFSIYKNNFLFFPLGIPQRVIDTSVKICMKVADLSINLRENEQAVNSYKDALFISPNNFTILTALAKLYLQVIILIN